MIAAENPQRALELVARFQDEELRNYNTTVIARSWIERDRDAADAGSSTPISRPTSASGPI